MEQHEVDFVLAEVVKYAADLHDSPEQVRIVLVHAHRTG